MSGGEVIVGREGRQPVASMHHTPDKKIRYRSVQPLRWSKFWPVTLSQPVYASWNNLLRLKPRRNFCACCFQQC